MDAADEGSTPLPADFRKRFSWRALNEGTLQNLCLVASLLSIATTFGIIYVLFDESVRFFRWISPREFFLGTVWTPLFEPARFGILPLLSGTFQIALGAGLFALPVGLLSAIYLSEFASARTRGILKPILEVLAGVPTVVYGYFGLLFVTPLLRRFFPDVQVFNAASGSIVVGIMILPLVSSLCEDALYAVPRALREGAYAVGSTKLEVTMKVVVPAALSGIMSAFILAISRAVGETMAVTIAAGNTPKLTLNFAESIQTMTAYIVQVSLGDTPAGSPVYRTIFAVGMSLFVITLLMNLVAQALVRRYRSVYS
ncbi:MAG: phosphate ABC transporter permease subunit PstC [Fimbriimonadaceae bacterium]|nr:phosphate ABC transporter permease subunit PstC [Fimbriimonadaceae bacterium]